MVGVIPGFTMVQRKPWLSLVIDENFTLFSIYLRANVLIFFKISNNDKNNQLVSHFCTFIPF
jgi:hypothetical protein